MSKKFASSGADLTLLEIENDLGLLVRTTLEIMWSFYNGDWDITLSNLKLEVGKEAEESMQWLRAAATSASQLSDAK